MSDYNISDANSVFTITVSSLFNAPVTLSNYSADRAFEADQRELAETQMSVDGYLSAGWVPQPVHQSVSLAASSDSCLVFESIVTAQDVARTIYRIGGEIQLPSVGRRYTLLRGVLRAASALPNAGRVLDARRFDILWERVLPAAL
ncbi:hypothetical protein IFJ82_03055 [Novacetimonas hansenii]|uniref:Uncharacterized protein n=2 Tax=Novacetimonas hansenii TaxID=436 RepID=A0AAW5EUI2_NOVHA|nr:hypothetical protein [Novacetimonas hansenii]EFG83022.1 hypothetical protein GXY_15042 [Novacetimonas hansenii ATCC 23769]MBL7235922.1 hypothetical protein [Novacetimonas hansenii]MCJ8354945.1 hypothetical protein [Novacetimonas hansenii]PYD73366.1 hypothetical protein CFR74_04380 [Novacetimonas hansenii]QOF95660.1 hypothetical protein IFJ82_03055 [Novacetimonas hansenii]